MRNPRVPIPLRRLGLLGGVPLLALALEAGDVRAREPDSVSACGTTAPVHGVPAAPKALTPARATPPPAAESRPAPDAIRTEKRAGRPAPPSRVRRGEQRRGGVGMLFGITFA